MPERMLGFLNDGQPTGSRIAGYEVLGGFADWSRLPSDVLFNAPLHKVRESQQRSALVEALGIPDERWASLLHPLCNVARSVVIGPGASIGAFSDLQPGVCLGRHVGMRSGIYLGHDTQVGDFAFIAGGVSVGGYSRIGRGAFVGLNATIRDNVTIGDHAIIGMGACVSRDVKDFEIFAGNPARRVGYIPRLGDHE
jgi:sugar O-acyltransferase (sialic acid O-acetyltransferase NeuD family)